MMFKRCQECNKTILETGEKERAWCLTHDGKYVKHLIGGKIVWQKI